MSLSIFSTSSLLDKGKTTARLVARQVLGEEDEASSPHALRHHPPVTTAPPFDRPAVTAVVHIDHDTGGTVERPLPGTALGWTRDAVLVEIDHEGQRYQVWVKAEHVTRRDIAATPDTP